MTAWRRIALAGTIALVAAAAFRQSVRFSFVNYDDRIYVTENAHVTGGLSAENALWAFTSCGYALNWHPLAWLSMQADATVAKFAGIEIRNPKTGKVDEASPLSRLMHVHNVALHAANAVLLFALLSALARLVGGDGRECEIAGAAFALLWAVHPLRCEVVCWASERKELLSVFWMLAAMLAYLRPRAGKWRYAASLFFFALALLSKPVAVTLPAALFAWDWCIRRRPFRMAAARQIPFAVLSAGTCAMTMLAQTEALEVGDTHYTAWNRLAMTLYAPAVYLRQTFWPAELSVHYPTHPDTPWTELVAGTVLVIGVAYVCVRWLRRREKWAAFGVFAVAWGYVGLLPMLGIVKVGDQPHSDRYTYWAGCAVAAVACVAAVRVFVALPKVARETWKRRCAAIAVCAMAILFVAAERRAATWRDTFTLFSDSVPKCWAEMPVLTLAGELRQRGKEGVAAAEALLREALGHSKFASFYAELGHLLAVRTEKVRYIESEDGKAHEFDEARLFAERALAMDPKCGRGHEALAVVKMREEKWEEALELLGKARECGEDGERMDTESKICREAIGVQGK